MINYNGTILENSCLNIENNRGYLFGDSIFETIKVYGNKILFSEAHYLRLMASMRICRMEIPMTFTLEFFEAEILKLVQTKNYISSRIRFSVFRNTSGFYNPTFNDIEFIVSVYELQLSNYEINTSKYEVELFKDFYIAKNLLSTLKTNNKMINIVASVYAKENFVDNCLLINEDKNVVEATNGNVFMLIDNKLITPSILDGCLNGIMRKQIIAIVSKIEEIEIIEKSISPFDLQKADELFITNVITGIQPITKYRKKEYISLFSRRLVEELNKLIK